MEEVVRNATQAERLRAVRELHPEGFDQLQRTVEASWVASDSQVLELCRRRIAELLHGEGASPTSFTAAGTSGGRVVEIVEAKLSALQEWETSDLFSDDEKAHLRICEQFVTSVSSIADEEVAELRRTRSEAEVYAFIASLYVIEMSERAMTALERAGCQT